MAYRGEVEATRTRLGTLLIHHTPWRERKLFAYTEYDLWRWEVRPS